MHHLDGLPRPASSRLDWTLDGLKAGLTRSSAADASRPRPHGLRGACSPHRRHILLRPMQAGMGQGEDARSRAVWHLPSWLLNRVYGATRTTTGVIVPESGTAALRRTSARDGSSTEAWSVNSLGPVLSLCVGFCEWAGPLR